MGKKHKRERKRDDARKCASEQRKNVKAATTRTWMGPQFHAEHFALRDHVRKLNVLPYMGITGAPDGGVGSWMAEEVATALARCHLRMLHLVKTWEDAGFPAKDAPTMRVVRADMRVLAELSLTMFQELMEMGNVSTVGEKQ